MQTRPPLRRSPVATPRRCARCGQFVGCRVPVCCLSVRVGVACLPCCLPPVLAARPRLPLPWDGSSCMVLCLLPIPPHGMYSPFTAAGAGGGTPAAVRCRGFCCGGAAAPAGAAGGRAGRAGSTARRGEWMRSLEWQGRVWQARRRSWQTRSTWRWSDTHCRGGWTRQAGGRTVGPAG